MATAAGTSIASMMSQGGILGVQITWTCDLDESATSCTPVIEFSRLDNPNSTVPLAGSSGR